MKEKGADRGLIKRVERKNVQRVSRLSQNDKHCKKETYLFGFKNLKKLEFYRAVSFWNVRG